MMQTQLPTVSSGMRENVRCRRYWSWHLSRTGPQGVADGGSVSRGAPSPRIRPVPMEP